MQRQIQIKSATNHSCELSLHEGQLHTQLHGSLEPQPTLPSTAYTKSQPKTKHCINQNPPLISYTDQGKTALMHETSGCEATLPQWRALPMAVKERQQGGQASRGQESLERRNRRHYTGRNTQDLRRENYLGSSQSPRQAANRFPPQGAPNPPPSPAPQRNNPRQTSGGRRGRGSFSADHSNSRVPNAWRQYTDRPYPPGDFLQYFSPGTVFKRPAPTMAAPGFNLSTNTDSRYSGTQFGPVFTEPTHYIVCGVYERSCRCLAFHTYGGRALSRRGMTDAAAQNHAVVYSSGQSPPCEPRTTRQPIEVIMERKQELLDEMSRLDLGKIFPIEMNQPIIHIGKVSPQSLDDFFGYVREILNEQLSQLPASVNEQAFVNNNAIGNAAP